MPTEPASSQGTRSLNSGPPACLRAHLPHPALAALTPRADSLLLLSTDSSGPKINTKIESIKNYLQENRTEYLSQFVGVNKFMNIKNGGYHQKQDGCVEIHKTKDDCTIKSNKINIRRKAADKEKYSR